MKTLITLTIVALLSGCNSYQQQQASFNDERQSISSAYSAGFMTEAEYTAQMNMIHYRELEVRNQQQSRQQAFKAIGDSWSKAREQRDAKNLQRAQTQYYNNQNLNQYRGY